MKKISHSFISLSGLGAVMLSLTLFPLLASAETVVRTGNSVSIGVDQTVGNDLYAAAGSISLSGEIKADTYVAAGSVTINGPVGADLTVLGGTIQAHSSIGDDVRAIGGDVVIAGDVGGDVFVVGGHLKLLSSAKVAGNVYFYGGQAEIEGTVTGSVMGQAEEFDIDGSVGGTDLSADKVILGSRAKVGGDLRYQSAAELERAVGAEVKGEVIAVALSEETQPDRRSDPSLVLALVWVLTSLSLFLIGKKFLARLLKHVEAEPIKVGLVGLAASLAAPAVAVVLILTIIGAWAGIALLIFTALLFIVALAVLPLLVGGYLYGFYRPNAPISLISALIGLLVVLLLIKLPFLGGLLIFVGLIFTTGALLQVCYKMVKGAI